MAFGGSAHSITDIWTTMYLFIDDYITFNEKRQYSSGANSPFGMNNLGAP